MLAHCFWIIPHVLMLGLVTSGCFFFKMLMAFTRHHISSQSSCRSHVILICVWQVFDMVSADSSKAPPSSGPSRAIKPSLPPRTFHLCPFTMADSPGSITTLMQSAPSKCLLALASSTDLAQSASGWYVSSQVQLILKKSPDLTRYAGLKHACDFLSWVLRACPSALSHELLNCAALANWELIPNKATFRLDGS